MLEAERLLKLPTYVFALLDKLKAEERAKGQDLIDLSIGSPNVPPPAKVVEAMKQALDDPQNHRYSSFEGSPEFKSAVIDWCQRQYNIKIETDEIIELLGSKEGLVHFCFATLNPGDIVLVPMPAYPAHFRGPLLAGAQPYILPTSEINGFIPDLDNIDEAVAHKAKLLFISYPTNPTGATAPKEFFIKAVAFAKKYNLILLHDFAYGEVYFEGQKPISCLSIPGAKEVCIEFHTLSKTFGMAGWRVGFAVGNKKLIASLKKIKTNLDYGLFSAVQKAAVAAMRVKGDYLDRMRSIYEERRDVLVDGLNRLGWKIKKPQASLYVWIPIPDGFNSTSFSQLLLEKTGVVVSPGIAFGDPGEGYVRFALVDTKDRLIEAVSRMEKVNKKWIGQ